MLKFLRHGPRVGARPGASGVAWASLWLGQCFRKQAWVQKKPVGAPRDTTEPKNRRSLITDVRGWILGAEGMAFLAFVLL